ncbi:Uncharacterised protein [Chromobacterium violaceum]|uniref:Uncharacterized protein n=1 Tax=Chromobacterium violaceum TaxID=536 RepID=A0A3S5DLE1_CHRVL|nr:Uncharacterised protein [Chromobacterium violaceum]
MFEMEERLAEQLGVHVQLISENGLTGRNAAGCWKSPRKSSACLLLNAVGGCRMPRMASTGCERRQPGTPPGRSLAAKRLQLPPCHRR